MPAPSMRKRTWRALNPCLERGTAKRPMKNTDRRHATRNEPRDASYISGFSYEKLAVSFKAKYARLRTLPRSLSGFPGSFFAVHCATAAKGFALSGRRRQPCDCRLCQRTNVQRNSFLETSRIIALPIPKSNRKEQSAKPLGGGSALPCANPSPPMAQPCLPWVKEKSAPGERNVGYG